MELPRPTTARGFKAWNHLAEPSPEVKDHAPEQAELVRELTTLHEAWERGLGAP